MQYARVGGFLGVSRITGPTHNLLQLLLTNMQIPNPICERLLLQSDAGRAQLNEEALVEAVLKGVAEANKELGTSYSVAHIKYVEGDSPPEEVYSYLAQSIVKHLASGGEFVSGSPV